MEQEYWDLRAIDVIIVIASTFGLIYLYTLLDNMNPQYPFFLYKFLFLLIFVYLEFIIIKAIQDKNKVYQDPNTKADISVENLNQYMRYRVLPIILIGSLIILYFIFMQYFNMSWNRIFFSYDTAILMYLLVFISIGWLIFKLIMETYIFLTIMALENEMGRKVVSKTRFFIVELVILLFLFHNITSLKVDNVATWIISILVVTVTMFLFYRTNTFDQVKDWKENEARLASDDEDHFVIKTTHIIILIAIGIGIICYFVIPTFQGFINYNVLLAFSFTSIYGFVVLILIFFTVIWGTLEIILVGLAIIFRYITAEKGSGLIFRIQFFIILFITLKLILFNVQFLYIRDDIEYYMSLGITLVCLLISYKVGLINLSYKIGFVM